MKKTSTPRRPLAAGIAKILKRLHYPLDVMLLCVRWYVAYSLSLRDLEEMMAERAIGVDHSTVHRWVIKLVPLFEKTFRRHKRPVGKSWRMDETYIKVKARGNTCIALSTRRVTPLTFCSETSVTRLLPGGSLKRQSVRTVRQRQ
jgi:transposase-like protein